MVVEQMAGKRGRKSQPGKGLLAVVPCKLNEMLRARGKTQAAFTEEINSDKGTMEILGVKKFPRSTLALMAAGRILPSGNVLAAISIYLRCSVEDLYEPYVLVMIGYPGYKKVDWIKEGGSW